MIIEQLNTFHTSFLSTFGFSLAFFMAFFGYILSKKESNLKNQMIESLRRDLEQKSRELEQKSRELEIATVDASVAERVADKVDAERYRYLRHVGGRSWRGYKAGENPKKCEGHQVTGVDYDAVVDAERKEAAK